MRKLDFFSAFAWRVVDSTPLLPGEHICDAVMLCVFPHLLLFGMYRVAQDRLLATLEVCSSSEYRDTLQRVKMRLFAQILQVMEFQFLNVSSEGAEAMRILQVRAV